MRLSRLMSSFLFAFGVWSWVIWPTFLVNIAKDGRSWASSGGPTAFFMVHLMLAIVSLLAGTVIGVLGVRGWLAARSRANSADDSDDAPAPGGSSVGAGRGV
ncbi:MAG: SCO4848 family membrane protein [Sciscionella sp.]